MHIEVNHKPVDYINIVLFSFDGIRCVKIMSHMSL